MNPVPIEVSAGVLVHDGRILITRRPPGSHLAGLWEFPGGKRQPGESWEACLVRELEEEIGVTVAVGGIRFETVHQYPGKSVHLRFFDCTLVQGEPRPVECAEVAWVRPTELTQHIFPNADRELVDRLASGEM